MQRWSKGVLYAAVAMLGLGGLLVFLAWDGAASVGGRVPGIDYTQGQIPFLISGGIGGLALVAAGLALLVVHSLRRDMLELGTKLDAIVDALHGLRGSGLAGGAAIGAQVVAGRTTYHNADCHLIEGRTDLQLMLPSEAGERGLAPCRICSPRDDTSEVKVQAESV